MRTHMGAFFFFKSRIQSKCKYYKHLLFVLTCVGNLLLIGQTVEDVELGGLIGIDGKARVLFGNVHSPRNDYCPAAGEMASHLMILASPCGIGAS